MKGSAITVTAVGLSEFEQETLDVMLRLSTRYELVDKKSKRTVDVVLVNIDSAEAILYWKSNLDRPDLRTIVVAEEPGRYGDITYLPRRLIRRPCFAKQVLGLLDMVAPRAVEETVEIEQTGTQPKRWQSLFSRVEKAAQRRFGRALSGADDEPTDNPYYTA